MIPRAALLSVPVLSLAAALSCGSRTGVTPSKNGVRPGVVAAAGADDVDVATVARIAAAEQVAPSVAVERAVDDALVAAEARRLYGDGRARQARRSALARTLLETFVEDARRRGPPTDDEVAQATRKRWWELDRPRLLRTTHAVVLVKNPADEARARALIGRIAERVAGISDPVAFKLAAAAVPTEGLEVRVEDLPPITSDGTIIDVDAPEPKAPTGAILPGFATAAFAIPALGSESPIVHTDYGYHVILAVASIPEHRVPLEERRSLLAKDVRNARASASYDAALAHAKSIDAVAYERSAVDTMLQVKAVP
jgi:hypothetical protein